MNIGNTEPRVGTRSAFEATTVDGMPSRETYPRLAAYWAGLPDGWDSHPECLVSDAIVDVFRDRGVFDELALMPAPLERAAREASATGWIPEVLYVGLFLATRDVHFYDASDRLFEDWWLQVGKERVDRGAPPASADEQPVVGLRAAEALYGSNHRGTSLECEWIAPHRAELRLVHPPHLFPQTMLDVYARSIALFLVRQGAAVPVVHARPHSGAPTDGEVFSTFVAEWT